MPGHGMCSPLQLEHDFIALIHGQGWSILLWVLYNHLSWRWSQADYRLLLQLTSPVQWQLTIETLLGKGLERSIEIGPNKVIAGIMKRIDKEHNISNISA